MLTVARVRLALSFPPHRLAKRIASAIYRRLTKSRRRMRDLARSTYALETSAGALAEICAPVPREAFVPHRGWIESVASRVISGSFDLLGSGWTDVTVRAGLPPLDERLNATNRDQSRRIARLIDADYRPIDWQRDFKSGHRWAENTWSRDIRFSHLPKVDVKVPWELARMQHLLILAWAHGLNGPDLSPYAKAFRNQILDFIAANPPRFGVNWICTMDVAIRAANWVAAYGLLRSMGVRFDSAFEEELKRSLLDHGHHVRANLEIYPEGRGNHYLADICGLVFIAAALPRGGESDEWLSFAADAAVGELGYQFNTDGSNFEGSTAYHRLSTEMVTYAMALLIGQDGDVASIPGHVRPALLKAADFLIDVTKANGRIVQVGDNDSGRFFKPHPIYAKVGEEDHLDCRGTVAAINMLSGRPADVDRLDAILVRALVRGRCLNGASPQPPIRSRGDRFPDMPSDTASRIVEIEILGSDLVHGLTCVGYPDFGLWIFRSRRLFLSVRCGPSRGAGASGSHAHNDQLALELAIDGDDWIADPGSYLYCLPIAQRNSWRSVRAHAAPQWTDREPGSLDAGNFQLVDKSHAQCLFFGPQGFVGEHRGFPELVRRSIHLSGNVIRISDFGTPERVGKLVCRTRAEVLAVFPSSVPFSPGYGLLRDL